MSADFLPAASSEAFFDAQCGAWVISHYGEVAAALREPALYQVSSTGETFPTGEDETSRSRVFLQVRSELARIGTGQYRPQMQETAAKIIGANSTRRVDLLAGIAHPWCVQFLMQLGGSAARLIGPVTELSWALLYKHLNEHRSTVPDREAAPHEEDPDKQIDRFLERKELSVSKSMFIAVSTTLPSFLAKAWLALLQNPEQAARLVAEPTLMPSAIEELLRYAGIVHTLRRKAIRKVRIGEIAIEQGQIVLLKVSSANFDPGHFDEPHRLNLARKPAGQLALGAGLHACVGATLVREASAVLTPIVLAADPVLESDQTIEWMGNSTLKWPLSVFARFGK